MSGIPIHAGDPISPPKASGITPHTAPSPVARLPEQSATPTAASQTYNPARPGAVAPTPTSKNTSKSSYDPPAPQPRAVPIPSQPTITAKPSLPPPPKAGERPMPSEFYAPVRSVAAPPQPFPPQMSQSSLGAPQRGLPPGSTTSTTTAPSFPPSAPPVKPPTSTEGASLEHPQGYVQNPFASDMTADQRFATGLQEDRSDNPPSLGYADNKQGPSKGGDESALETAAGWAKEQARKAGELHGWIWEKAKNL